MITERFILCLCKCAYWILRFLSAVVNENCGSWVKSNKLSIHLNCRQLDTNPVGQFIGFVKDTVNFPKRDWILRIFLAKFRDFLWMNNEQWTYTRIFRESWVVGYKPWRSILRVRDRHSEPHLPSRGWTSSNL